MIGTPFVTKDEIHNRKIANIDKKPWEQVVIICLIYIYLYICI